MKLISILIPIYNEERFILDCLKSVLEFKVPDDVATEILLIDGNSTDKTLEIIRNNFQEASNFKIFSNPHRIQSNALNIGIKNSKGEYILRLDAHACYPKDYLVKLLDTMNRVDADNVGGLVITLPADDSYNAALVQALTTHKFGVGNSGFRTGAKEGYVDTVPYGFFKKKLFERIGMFDERLVRAQDYELNCRIRKANGKIWLNPTIEICYYNQPTFMKFIKKQFLFEAPYNAYMWFVTPSTFTFRHSITAFFTLGILVGPIISLIYSPVMSFYFFVISLYFILAIASSIHQAIKYKKLLHVAFLPFCFFIYHFSHGTGILIGILKLLSKRSPIHNIAKQFS